MSFPKVVFHTLFALVILWVGCSKKGEINVPEVILEKKMTKLKTLIINKGTCFNYTGHNFSM